MAGYTYGQLPKVGENDVPDNRRSDNFDLRIMPLFREWNPDLHSLAAVWELRESESFFSSATGLDSAIRHDKRRIEFHAGRFLLRYLKADFPLHAIVPDEHDKPGLPGGGYHFSLSHSFPYVAAVISTKSGVGIDIQCWHERILALQHKFLSPGEQQWTRNDPERITLAWCAKEAAYKYQGRRGVDFIGHLPLQSWTDEVGVSKISIKLNMMDTTPDIRLDGFIYPDFALCVTV